MLCRQWPLLVFWTSSSSRRILCFRRYYDIHMPHEPPQTRHTPAYECALIHFSYLTEHHFLVLAYPGQHGITPYPLKRGAPTTKFGTWPLRGPVVCSPLLLPSSSTATPSAASSAYTQSIGLCLSSWVL